MSAHFTLEELLELQGAEPSSERAKHLEGCRSCAAERREIARRREQLRGLPILRPAEDRWPLIRARVLAARRTPRVLSAAVAAALIALTLTATALLQKSARPGPGPSDELAWLISESQYREQKLRALAEPEVMNVASADEIVQIEEQISEIDECIAEIGAAPESRELRAVLWQTRITLLDVLAQVRQPALARVMR